MYFNRAPTAELELSQDSKNADIESPEESEALPNELHITCIQGFASFDEISCFYYEII